MRLALVRFVLAAGLVVVMLAIARGAAPPLVEKPRLDVVGDPLPGDAIAQFGTARFRDAGIFGGVALSPDGKLLAVSGNEGIRLLDPATGKEVRRIKGQRPFFSAGTLMFSPEGKYLALADLMNVVVCDVDKPEMLPQFQPAGRAGQGSLSFSRDGKLLAVGGRGFREKLSVTIWDVAGKKERKKIESAHDREVHAVLSPDGKTLVAWGARQALRRQDEPVLHLEILERLATPEARRLLQTVANGSPGARLTIDAAETLKRLQRR
jgi:hypothetical protein